MSIFTKIVQGEIPSYKIAEDENFYSFLDINPLTKGHALVIPKKETDYIFDLEDKEFSSLWLFAKKVALAIEKVIPCEKVGIAVIGLEVRHAHIHLVPLQTGHDLDFSRPKVQLSSEEFIEILEDIKLAFEEVEL